MRDCFTTVACFSPTLLTACKQSETMDMETMCRTCFSQLKVPRNIFESKYLLERILKFTDIQIEKDDGLPSSICEICNLKLEIADNFRRDVGKTDIRIREMLKQTTFARDSRVRIMSSRSTSTFRAIRPIRDRYERRLNSGDQEKITKSVRSQPLQVSRSSFQSKSCKSEIKMERRGGLEEEKAPMTFDSSKAFIYSNANGRTLSNCYRLLIDHCLDYGVHEHFTLPSSFAYNDVNPESICARQMRSMSRETEVKSVSATADDTSTRCAEDLQMIRYLKTDPLNLLRIKTIRPLVERVDECLTEYSSSSASVTSSEEASQKSVWSSGTSESKSSSSVNCIFDVDNFGSPMKDDDRIRRDVSLIFETNERSANRTRRSGTPVNNEPRSVCPVCYRVCVNSFGVQDEAELCVQECDLDFECICCINEITYSCQFLFHAPVPKIHLKSHRSSHCPICAEPTLTKKSFRNHMKGHLHGAKKNQKNDHFRR